MTALGCKVAVDFGFVLGGSRLVKQQPISGALGCPLDRDMDFFWLCISSALMVARPSWVLTRIIIVVLFFWVRNPSQSSWIGRRHAQLFVRIVGSVSSFCFQGLSKSEIGVVSLQPTTQVRRTNAFSQPHGSWLTSALWSLGWI